MIKVLFVRFLKFDRSTKGWADHEGGLHRGFASKLLANHGRATSGRIGVVVFIPHFFLRMRLGPRSAI